MGVLDAFDAENEDEGADLRANARSRLRSLIERVERVTEEVKALQDDRKDIFAEAKAAGFDTLIMRAIIKRRQLDPATRDEMDSMLDLYEKELGM